VKGAKFERRVRRLARQMNVACTFVASEGKEAMAGFISAMNSPPSKIEGRKSAAAFSPRCAGI
jgi:hypothetical protein